MAGDWIKMRTDLLTHPKVVRMVSALKADKLRVIGGLHAVWSLFDAHSDDGTLDGYTLEVLDDHLGWPGFSASMKKVEWLTENVESLAVPRFDEHNGQSAKRRATETQRKRLARVPDQMSAPDADKKRSREEKRREEITVSKDTGSDAASLTKAELWSAGKSLLENAGMPKAQCGSFVGKLVKDYTDTVVIEAVRAAVFTNPADPAEYLKAACQIAAGQRKPVEPEWRTEQRTRTQIAAPGVAVGSMPAHQFFTEIEARNVTPARLG